MFRESLIGIIIRSFNYNYETLIHNLLKKAGLKNEGSIRIKNFIISALNKIYSNETMEDEELKYCYKYPRLGMTVDAIIVAQNFSQDMVLLIQRKFGPFEGIWALPGGFVGMEETLVEACHRELFEETGINNVELNQFYTFDAVNRDPRHRTITTAFYGRINETSTVYGGDDAAKADWFPIISLPDMAFDHAEIIGKFIKEKL